jgi:hypothetical protein
MNASALVELSPGDELGAVLRVRDPGFLLVGGA